jgi:hypothetical protein
VNATFCQRRNLQPPKFLELLAEVMGFNAPVRGMVERELSITPYN